SARRNPFRSSPDPPAQILVPEIYNSCERRGQAQTPHMLIATGQEHAKLPRWEAKHLFPLRDKGSIWKSTDIWPSELQGDGRCDTRPGYGPTSRGRFTARVSRA